MEPVIGTSDEGTLATAAGEILMERRKNQISLVSALHTEQNHEVMRREPPIPITNSNEAGLVSVGEECWRTLTPLTPPAKLRVCGRPSLLIGPCGVGVGGRFSDNFVQGARELEFPLDPGITLGERAEEVTLRVTLPSHWA